MFSPTELFAAQADTPLIAQVVTQMVPRETLDAMSSRIADQWDIPSTTLSNLWHSESNGSTTIENKGGDRGLVQINRVSHPEVSDAQAFDAEYALNYAAHAIASSTDDQFTVCNCYAFLKTKIRGLPHMDALIPNSTPHVGAVAIFDYRDKKTGLRTKHVAYIQSIGVDGFTVAESNFSPCLTDRRRIAWDDPHLSGFFDLGATHG